MPTHRINKILGHLIPPTKTIPTVQPKATSTENIARTRTAFTAWKAHWHERRNSQLFYQAQQIEIETCARRNFKKLLQTIRLTKEEKRWVMSILDSNSLYLLHYTEHAEAIKKDRHMRSVLERAKRSPTGVTEADHTGSFIGNNDNLFFTPRFGEDRYGVDFLSTTPHVIRIHLNTLKQSAPLIFRQFWFTEQIYSYSKEAVIPTEIFYGTKRQIQHKQELMKDTGKLSQYRLTTYIYANGTHHTEKTEKGDFIFLAQHLELAMCLSAIQQIRLLGVDAHRQVMAETSLKAKQELINALFHESNFEVLKPVELAIEYPGIEIMPTNARDTSGRFPTCSPEQFLLAFNGHTKEVLELIMHHPDCGNRNCVNYPGLLLSLLNGAILGGQIETIAMILDTPKAQYLHTEHDLLLNENDFSQPQASLHPLIATMGLLEPEKLQPYFKMITITAHPKKAQQITQMLCQYGVMKKNLNIRAPLLLTKRYNIFQALALGFSTDTIKAFLSYTDGVTNHFILEKTVVYLLEKRLNKTSSFDAKEVVQLIASLNIDIQSLLYMPGLYTSGSRRDNGLYPFLCFLLLEYPHLIESFVTMSPAVDLEKRIMVYTRDRLTNEPLHDTLTPSLYLGYTPLLLAFELELYEQANILLEAGADANCTNWHGETSAMIAARKGNHRLIELSARYQKMSKEDVEILHRTTTTPDRAKFIFNRQYIIIKMKDTTGKAIFAFEEEFDAALNVTNSLPIIQKIQKRLLRIIGRDARVNTDHLAMTKVPSLVHRIDDQIYRTECIVAELDIILSAHNIQKRYRNNDLIFTANRDYLILTDAEEALGDILYIEELLINMFRGSTDLASTELMYKRKISLQQEVVQAICSGDFKKYHECILLDPSILKKDNCYVISKNREQYYSDCLIDIAIREEQFEIAEQLARDAKTQFLNEIARETLIRYDQGRLLSLIYGDKMRHLYYFLQDALEKSAVECVFHTWQKLSVEKKAMIKLSKFYMTDDFFNKTAEKVLPYFLQVKRSGDAQAKIILTDLLDLMTWLFPYKTEVWLETQEARFRDPEPAAAPSVKPLR